MRLHTKTFHTQKRRLDTGFTAVKKPVPATDGRQSSLPGYLSARETQGPARGGTTGLEITHRTI